MLYRVVVSEAINEVVEFFPTRRQADRMLGKVLFFAGELSGV
jgi:hypothetical protein